MIINCDRCTMHETEACHDCVVSALVGSGGILALADEEKQAMDEMSRVGLIPPIRLVDQSVRSVVPGP